MFVVHALTTVQAKTIRTTTALYGPFDTEEAGQEFLISLGSNTHGSVWSVIAPDESVEEEPAKPTEAKKSDDKSDG